jgi:hypothetical protein
MVSEVRGVASSVVQASKTASTPFDCRSPVLCVEPSWDDHPNNRNLVRVDSQWANGSCSVLYCLRRSPAVGFRRGCEDGRTRPANCLVHGLAPNLILRGESKTSNRTGFANCYMRYRRAWLVMRKGGCGELCTGLAVCEPPWFNCKELCDVAPGLVVAVHFVQIEAEEVRQSATSFPEAKVESALAVKAA